MTQPAPTREMARGRTGRPLPRPVIKWAGGKTQLLRQLLAHVPGRFDHYWEPFVGSAALFFELRRAGRMGKATLSDVNPELIGLYRVIRDEVEPLIDRLQEHERWRLDRGYFYRVRNWDREPGWERRPAVERAARLIFLNKTCYNGLHRVNRRGQFNVPWGRYDDPRICDVVNLRAASAALTNVALEVGDFKSVLSRAGVGDLVYLDPPYLPTSATASFTAYSANTFGEAEHRELAITYGELLTRGCYPLLSNSDTPLVRQLYRGFDLRSVQARRAINAHGRGRGPVGELLVVGQGAPGGTL